jgi:hypothetical protein
MEYGLKRRLELSPINLHLPDNADKYFLHPQLQIKEFTLDTVSHISYTLKSYDIWDQILVFFILYNELDLLTDQELYNILSLYEPASSNNHTWKNFLIQIEEGIYDCSIGYLQFHIIYTNSYLEPIPTTDWNRIIMDIIDTKHQALAPLIRQHSL